MKYKKNSCLALKNPRNYFLFIIVGIYVIITINTVHNLDYAYLWFDEASQFWISKGLNPDSKPLSLTGDIVDVVLNNRDYNFDPGGFGILLHFWSMISNHHIWLRLLPFLFFLGTVGCFITLGYMWLKDKILAFIIGLVPFFFTMLLDLGFEIRAYSMEVMGTMICIIGIEKLQRTLNYQNLVMFSIVLCFFLTSRYSFSIVAFVASIYILYLVIQSNRSTGSKINLMIVYTLPIIITLVNIYFAALVYQNVDLRPLPYLPYLSENPLIILRPFNILFLISIFGCFLLLVFNNKYALINKYKSLLFLIFGVNFLFFILSLLGKHPWSVYTYRSISMIVPTLLFFSLLGGELLKLIFKGNSTINYSVLALILILFVIFKYESLYTRYGKSTETLAYFQSIDLEKYDRILVDRREGPSVKYLFEYGLLNSEKYLEKFTFIKGIKHNTGINKKQAWYANQPSMNEFDEYDLLITPELFQQKAKNESDEWKLIKGTNKFWIKKDKE